MKLINFLKVLMIVIVTGVTIMLLLMIYTTGKLNGVKETIKTYESHGYYQDKDALHLIWNDDNEGLPPAGSKVQIELIENNKVYIGNVDDSIFIN